MREVIFDTETTGLDPQKGDRLVEIGCIELVNRISTGKVLHFYFNPERNMPIEAEAVHGLSSTFLSDKPKFCEKAEAVLDFLGDAPLVAHNAGFDFAFLNAELGRCGLPALARSRMIDTVALARTRHPGARLSLDALCNRYGIDRSHRTQHGALLDAELLAQVYVELTGGRQIGLELTTKLVNPVPAAAPRVQRERIFRQARPHGPSQMEQSAHAAFLQSLKIPLWYAT